MKRFLLLAAIAASVFVTASAQYYGRGYYGGPYDNRDQEVLFREPMSKPGDMAIDMSFNVGYGSNRYGAGAGVKVILVDKLTLAPEYTYFFKRRYVSAHNLNVNLQYRISCGHVVTVYPFAGFTYINSRDEDYHMSDNLCGGNVGAGIEFRVSPNVSLFNENRFQFFGRDDKWGNDHNHFLSKLGLRFNFNF